MYVIKDDMENGLKAFVEDQQTAEGEATFTFIKFDTEYEVALDNVDINEVDMKSLTLEPRGATALADALGKAINAKGEYFRSLEESERPANVLFMVITDGKENASREFTRSQIANMIQDQTDIWNWSFVYLGADPSTFAEAAAIGINLDNAANYDLKKTSQLYKTMSGKLKTVRAGEASLQAAIKFDAQDRQDLISEA